MYRICKEELEIIYHLSYECKLMNQLKIKLFENINKIIQNISHLELRRTFNEQL